MKNSDDEFIEESGEKNYWLYFTGVMTVLVLVFALIFVMGFFQNKTYSKAVTEESAAEVSKVENIQEHEITDEDIKEQLAELESLRAELNEKEETIKQLMGVRSKIIRELVDEFAQSRLELDIDKQTGAIRFSEGIFFDSNQDIIKRDGMEYLNQFIPVYMSILLSDSNREYISQIIIEGHTDDQGSYLYNLDLSQRRAYAVVKYIISNSNVDFPNKQMAVKYLTANGRSYSQPIMTDGAVDRQKSRRVEFKFRLKDDELIKEMQKIFEGEK